MIKRIFTSCVVKKKNLKFSDPKKTLLRVIVGHEKIFFCWEIKRHRPIKALGDSSKSRVTQCVWILTGRNRNWSIRNLRRRSVLVAWNSERWLFDAECSNGIADKAAYFSLSRWYRIMYMSIVMPFVIATSWRCLTPEFIQLKTSNAHWTIPEILVIDIKK